MRRLSNESSCTSNFEAVSRFIGESRVENFWFKVEQADFRLRKELMSTGEISLMPGAVRALTNLREMVPGTLLGFVSNTNPSSAFWELWRLWTSPLFFLRLPSQLESILYIHFP